MTVTNRCDGIQILVAAAVPAGAGACGTPLHSCACIWAKSARGCPPRPHAPPPACPTSSRVCRRNRCLLGLVVVVGDGGFDDGVCCVGVVGDGAGSDPRKRTPPIAACTLGRPMTSAPDRLRRRLSPECPVRRAVCPRSWEADNSRRRLRKRTRPAASCNRWPHATTAPAVAATRRCNESAWARRGGLPLQQPDVVSFCDGVPAAVACSCGPTAGGSLRPSNLWTPFWTRRDRAVEIQKHRCSLIIRLYNTYILHIMHTINPYTDHPETCFVSIELPVKETRYLVLKPALPPQI